jgi:hypothetical protein
MEYVELLRARRLLTWYGGILFVLLALGLALAFKDGPPVVHMNGATQGSIPLGAILAGSAFGAVVLAAFMAVAFDAEFKTAAIIWTRPMSRMAIVARYLAVDAATLIAAWLITFAVVLIALTAVGLGKYIVPTQMDWFLLPLGCAVMWYGLVLLVSMLLPGRAGAIAGGSWAYALIVPGLSQIPFPPLLHQVVFALNYINPMAYIGTSSKNGTFLPGSPDAHTIAVWLIGIAAIAAGTRLWATREVPA